MRRLVIIPIVLFVFSCAELPAKFRFMNNLKGNIAAEYKTENIEISIENREELIVILKDHKFEELGPEEKKLMSFKIGELATALNEEGVEITNGHVKFLKEDAAGMVSKTDATTYRMFE